MAAGPGSSKRLAGGSGSVSDMTIEGHYDSQADIVWVRREDYDTDTVVTEETYAGLLEFDLGTGEIVGLEFWQATRELPTDFLRMLPPPHVGLVA